MASLVTGKDSKLVVKSGKDTAEYQKMMNNMEKLITALQVTPGAYDSLSTKCKAKGWYPPSSDTSEKDLVLLVIERIKQEASQFYLFISMLEDIIGLDQIVRSLKLTGILYIIVPRKILSIVTLQLSRSSFHVL